MIEEGLFDTIGKLFKKGADKASEKIEDNNTTINDLKNSLDSILNVPGNIGSDVVAMGKELKSAEMDNKVLAKIEELCKSAEEICAKLSEKEENAYKTISEKMTAANEAVKEFTKSSIAKIKEIAELSKNKIADIIAAVVMFCQRMAEYTKKALEVIGKGVVIAFALPFVLAFSLYKGALKVCEMLVEKVKDGAKILKDAFVKVKDAITNWVADMLKQAKDTLKKASDAIESGAKSAAKGIGKAFLAIVALLGQLASDAKDKISEAYNSFADSVKDFSDDVKAYVSEKWDVVSNWCKKTSTAFADGVKNVWGKMKEKVVSAVGAVKDAYSTLKTNAKATWDDIKEWNDERQQEDMKARMKYAADKWGKDTVESWVKEL
jgi:gas vesicle protein